MCFLFKPKTRRCYNELTADRSGAGRTVVHGAGVGPFLSVGCSLIAPLLQGAEERGAITHAATTAYTAENLQGLCLENQFHLLICCAREKFATPVPVRYVTISNMLLAVGWTPLLRALYLFTIAVLSEEETRTVPKKTQIRFKEEKERKMKVTWMKRLCMNNSSKHSPSFRYGFQRWERKWYS